MARRRRSRKDARFGMWIDGQRMVFELPPVPPEWQFLIDVFPTQLAAEQLARRSGVDCDFFLFCSYIVEDEYGLLHKEGGLRRMRPGRRNCDWSR
jgi:hypothetical protein